MYTLFIDTHDKNVLIILYKDSHILVKENILSPNRHSEITMPTIEKVMTENKIDVKDLESIIVVNGPGSFTGVRLAVTIAKTMSYALNIPIRVIDSLIIKALMIDADNKIVALEDRNGAYIGIFDKNNKFIKPYKYLNKNDYLIFKSHNDIVVDVDIDYEKVYQYAMSLEPINPHAVKPLYIKGISALNGK